MSDIFDYEIRKTAEALASHDGAFRIALVADSHLDNYVTLTVSHIQQVDSKQSFDCCVHLGDLLNGNIPRRCSGMLLKEQMELFRGSVRSGRFYPIMGNHDEHTGGCTPQFWQNAIRFLHTDPSVSGPQETAYYYVDDKKRKIRLIFLCSFHFRFAEGKWTKTFGFDLEQLNWLEKDALTVGPDWTVLLFSHDAPFSNFEETKLLSDNKKANGSLAIERLLSARNKYGFHLAGWLLGHFHGDMIKQFAGISFIFIGSQTAYVPQLWDMPEGGCYYERALGMLSEDLWDALVLDTDNHRLHLHRFGAGENRIVNY